MTSKKNYIYAYVIREAFDELYGNEEKVAGVSMGNVVLFRSPVLEKDVEIPMIIMVVVFSVRFMRASQRRKFTETSERHELSERGSVCRQQSLSVVQC